MKLKQLLTCLNLNYTGDCSNEEITGIVVDSRRVKPGDIFVALKGENLNGHQFIEEALRRGARAVVCEEEDVCSKDVPKILVKDAQLSLTKLCAAFYNYPSRNTKVIGVTGTNGKTTVSFLLERIIAQQGFKSGVIGTIFYNTLANSYSALNTTPQSDLLNCLLEEIQ